MRRLKLEEVETRCRNCGKSLEGMSRRSVRKYCSYKCGSQARFTESRRNHEYKITPFSPERRLKALTLYWSGVSGSEVARNLGIPIGTMNSWIREFGSLRKRTKGADTTNNEPLPESLTGRRSNAERNPGRYDRVAELYFGGLNGMQISRCLGISEGTVYYWIDEFGGTQERRFNPENIVYLTFEERIRLADSAEEWLRALRDCSDYPHATGEDEIRLVCEKVHGQGMVNFLASFIADHLALDPCNGETFAFCDKCDDTISTLQWANGTFRYGKMPKASGSYLWPCERFGGSIVVTGIEFEFILAYRKLHAVSSEKH